MSNRIVITCTLMLASMGFLARSAEAQMGTPTVLQLDETSLVNYNEDVVDSTKIATSPAITNVTTFPTFQHGVGLGDIVAVNGQAAKGLHVLRFTKLNASPTPATGQVIADITRDALIFHLWEILGADGTPIGSIMAQGFSRGTPPPGAPSVQTAANLAITGGTGAFAGVRGIAGSTNPPGSVANRQASSLEDPSYRRTNKGGSGSYILTLYPAESRQILAIAHADFSLVSTAKPATAGETLVLIATGLGPTRPAVEPGQPFPASPLLTVNSPVGVTINGTAANVLAAVGYPGATDGYQVNFQVPQGTAKGTVQVQVSAAWMAGPAVTMNVQ